MAFFADELARILASPVPRRKAMRMFGGAIAGGFLASLGIKEADAATCSPKCTLGRICCQGFGRPAFCAPAGTTCCGNTACLGFQTCCSGNTAAGFCAGFGQTCCGSRTCGFLQHCCQASTPFCTSDLQACCGSTACGIGQACCAGKCCQFGQVCCGNSTCCPLGRCVNGRCTVSTGGRG